MQEWNGSEQERCRVLHLKNFVARMRSECSCRRKTTGTQIKSEMETPSRYVLLLWLCPRYARCIMCCSTCTARTYRIPVAVIADSRSPMRQFAKCKLEVPRSANSTPRMSADGGIRMTATVSRDSGQLHLPWMLVCRNQRHANCQPVDTPAGTRSRVAPADDICRYRSRDICYCQTEEQGHWCASSSVYFERAYCGNAAHGDRRWHGRMPGIVSLIQRLVCCWERHLAISEDGQQLARLLNRRGRELKRRRYDSRWHRRGVAVAARRANLQCI